MALTIAIIFLVWLIHLQIKISDLDTKLDMIFKNNPEISQTSVNEEECIPLPINNEPQKEENNIPVQIPNENDFVDNKKPFSLESAFLGNIFNKIGAVALIIGIGIFIKLVSPFIVFTPAVKITLGYLVAFGMLIFGFKLNEEKMKNYKEVLFGTGVSVLFVTTYCASALFHIFNPICSIIIATLTLIGVYFLADKQKTVSMITIGLIGGYLNPLLITHNVSTEFFFGYYLILNLLSCVYILRNPNREVINFINIILTFVILSIHMMISSHSVNVTYPLILWLIYILYDVFRNNKSDNISDKYNILNWLNFSVLTLFSMLIFKDEKMYTGYLLISAGLLYAGLVIKGIAERKDNYKTYLYSAFMCVFLCTMFMTDGILRLALWAAESCILTLAGLKVREKNIINWAFGFIIASITAIFFIDNIAYFFDFTKYVPVLNDRTLAFSFPVISSLISAYILRKSDNEELRKIGELFRFSYISLIYLYLTFELNNVIQKYLQTRGDTDFISEMIIAIIGFKYAIQTKRIYNSNKYNLFNIASYIIGFYSLAYLLIKGWNYIPQENFIPVINIRFVGFVASVVAAVLYAKWTDNAFFKYLATVLGFILIHVETSDFIAIHSNFDYLITVMWLLYACIILLFGIFRDIKYLKNTGIWISIIAIFRIFIFDLADTDITYKLVAFLTLGIVLMVTSYFYNKKQ